VQNAAPLSLAVTLSVAVPSATWFVDQQMAQERDTLMRMSRTLDGIAQRLKTSARVQFARADQDEIDEAIAALAMPAVLDLPDETRWEAAGILARQGLMPPGELERSVRDFIDAVRDLMLTSTMPELRTGRFRVPPRDGAPQLHEAAVFDGPAATALRYYPAAARWLPRLEALADGQVGQHYRDRLGEVNDRLKMMRDRVPTAWWAHLTELRAASDNAPPGGLADLLRLPLEKTLKPMAEMKEWLGLRWTARNRDLLQKNGLCQVRTPQLYDLRRIPAPAERLTEEQQERQVTDPQTYFIGETYNVSAFAQCFAYHAPFGGENGDPDELIVVDLRLEYVALNQRVETDGPPCLAVPSRCWRSPFMPTIAPTSVNVLVDIPPSLSDNAEYPTRILAAFQDAIQGAGATVTQDVVDQGAARRAVRLQVKQGGQP
jgi:hypothetical protein